MKRKVYEIFWNQNSCLSFAWFFILFFLFSFEYIQAQSPWIYLGLKKELINSMTSNPYSQQELVVATKGSGIFFLDSAKIFKLLTNTSTGVQPPELKNTHVIQFVSNEQLLACCDSGVYTYIYKSGQPSEWIFLKKLFFQHITYQRDTIIGFNDIMVYTSIDKGINWELCKIPFIDNKRPIFTSAQFWYNNIAISSKEWIGGARPWYGVGLRNSATKTWIDISNLPGQEKPLAPVSSLLSYKTKYGAPFFLMAATDSGLRYVRDIDTGSWHPFKPQLPAVPVNHLHVSYFSDSEFPIFFASTRNGIYILKNQSNIWELSLPISTNQVVSPIQYDPRRIFAATDSGIYWYSIWNNLKYSPPHLESIKQVKYSYLITEDKEIIKNDKMVAMKVYLPNGKLIATIPSNHKSPSLSKGIYLIHF